MEKGLFLLQFAAIFKGTVQQTEFFELFIATKSSLGPHTIWGTFSILASFLWSYSNSKMDVNSRESQLPVSFTVGSQDSPYRLWPGVDNTMIRVGL